LGRKMAQAGSASNLIRPVPEPNPRAVPTARLRPPVELVAEILGGRFTAPILWSLFWGGKRFVQILRDLRRVPRRSLATRLEELEGVGLVERRFSAGVDRDGVEYVLTELGCSLRPLLGGMYHWGLKAAERPDARPLLAAIEPTLGPRPKRLRPAAEPASPPAARASDD